MTARPSNAPAWLVARPIAHRGLHDTARGIVENTASAARAAIDRGFAIECDVQLTSDGDAVVFHDFTLDRLTGDSGAVAERTGAALRAIRYRTGTDCIIDLSAFLALVAGRVPVICEVKSRFDGDLRLAARVRAIAAGYAGPLALKSFDPLPIIHLRRDPPCPLGIVAEAEYRDPEWALLTGGQKRELAALAHFGESRPDFLSFHVNDLPHAAPLLCRTALECPVMTWTVRTATQHALAARWADQIVFEAFLPP